MSIGTHSIERGYAVCAVLIFHALCDDVGVNFVGDNVFWIVDVALCVNVVHDALDVLHPGFHLDVGGRSVQPVKHAVRGSFRVGSATHASFLLSARALFAVGPLCVAPVKHWNRVFYALSFGKVVLGQLQFVGFVYEIHNGRVVTLHLRALRVGCYMWRRPFLTHRFKLGGDFLFESERMCFNSGINSALHCSCVLVFLCSCVLVSSVTMHIGQCF